MCVCLCICVNVCSVHSEAGRPRVHICYGVLLSRSPYAVTQSLFFSSPSYPRWPPQSSLFNRGMQMLYTHSCHVNTDTHTHNHIHVRSTDCGKAETLLFIYFCFFLHVFCSFFFNRKIMLLFDSWVCCDLHHKVVVTVTEDCRCFVLLLSVFHTLF